MQIIDESHAMALVRGFKRKYKDRLNRKPKPVNISSALFKNSPKKAMKKAFEYAEYAQRIYGNKLTGPELFNNRLFAHNIVVDGNRIKIAIFEMSNGRFTFGPSGVVITDHALARYLQRQGMTDVEMAVATLGLQMLLTCMRMDLHSKKTGLLLKEEQEIEAMTQNGGFVFIEVGKVYSDKPLMMAELHLKTYISPAHVDGRNGVRPAVFEERYAD